METRRAVAPRSPFPNRWRRRSEMELVKAAHEGGDIGGGLGGWGAWSGGSDGDVCGGGVRGVVRGGVGGAC